MRTPALALLTLALGAATAGCGIFGGGDEPGDLQVYSARHYDLEEAFVEFEEETGLKVDFLFAEDADLLKRLEAEGDGLAGGPLHHRRRRQPVGGRSRPACSSDTDSPVLDKAVPAKYRDADGAWYGLALRARTVVYNPDNVDPREFDTENTYAGLGDPKWKGRLCMRDSTEAYTQSLVAALIETYGRDESRGDRAELAGQRRRHHEQRHPAARGGRRRHLRRGAGQPLLPGA